MAEACRNQRGLSATLDGVGAGRFLGVGLPGGGRRQGAHFLLLPRQWPLGAAEVRVRALHGLCSASAEVSNPPCRSEPAEAGV